MGLINAQPAQQILSQDQPIPAQDQPAPQAKTGVDDTARKRVILAAAKIIYDPATTKNLLDLIRKAKTPEEGLAQATVLVMVRMAEMSKGTMPQSVKVQAAKGIMALIAELAEKAGIIDDMAQAVKRASQLIASAIMQGIKANPEQRQQTKQPVAQPGQQIPAGQQTPAQTGVL